MTPSPLKIIQRRHRLGQGTRAVWAAVGALALDLVLGWLGADPAVRPWVWAAGALVALGAACWPRRALRETARKLDTQLGARSRLEAIVEFGPRDDALAEAAREEAGVFLRGHPLPRAHAWLAGLGVLALLVAVNLTGLNAWSARAEAAKAVAQKKAEKKPVAPKPAPAAPPAVLRWVTPAAEITATPQETIPLGAEAESTTGLQQVRLHVAVNGEERAPVPVTETVQGGVQALTLSLALETYGVRPDDIVAYHLRAELIRPKDVAPGPAWPGISSELQVVLVERPKDEGPPGSGPPSPLEKVLRAVQRLKREQAAVMRAAFTLGQDTAPRSDPAWMEAVRAVEEREHAIDQEVTALVPTLEAEDVPAEAMEALSETLIATKKAGAELSRAEPKTAVAPASRALGQLSALERELARMLRLNLARMPNEEDKRNEKPDTAALPPRAETPAGRLENLARRQKALADKVAARTAESGLFTEQEAVAREAAKLAEERGLSEEVKKGVAAGAAAGREAAGQMNEQDLAAAAEPATRAAQALGEAAASLEATGRARTAEELLAAQRVLIREATEIETAPTKDFPAVAEAASRHVATLQRDLQAAARQQQRQGSAEGAQKLEALAKAIAASEVVKQLAEAAQRHPSQTAEEQAWEREADVRKLMELAQGAADAAGGFEDARQAQARASEALERMQASLERVAAAEEKEEKRASELKQLYQKTLAIAQQVSPPGNGPRMAPPPGPEATPEQIKDYTGLLSARMRGLMGLALAAKNERQRTQVLTTGNPGEAPPAYRPAVADYFEALARDGAARPPSKP